MATKITMEPFRRGTPFISFSQGDIGRAFTLTTDDALDSDASYSLVGTKSNGLGFSVPLSFVNNRELSGISTKELTESVGDFPAEIRATKEGYRVGSANLNIMVEKDPHIDGVIDGTGPELKDEIRVSFDNMTQYIEESRREVADNRDAASQSAQDSEASATRSNTYMTQATRMAQLSGDNAMYAFNHSTEAEEHAESARNSAATAESAKETAVSASMACTMVDISELLTLCPNGLPDETGEAFGITITEKKLFRIGSRVTGQISFRTDGPNVNTSTFRMYLSSSDTEVLPYIKPHTTSALIGTCVYHLNRAESYEIYTRTAIADFIEDMRLNDTFKGSLIQFSYPGSKASMYGTFFIDYICRKELQVLTDINNTEF